MGGESGCGDRVAELDQKLMRSEKEECLEFLGQWYTLIMKLLSDESQKLCGNLKGSDATLQMRASKGAITFGVQGGIGTGTRMLDVILPHTQEQINEAAMVIPKERIRECIAEEIIEVVEFGPRDLVQDRTVEQIVDGPVLQVPEQVGEVNQLIPQERVPESIDEQIVDVSVPQIRKVTQIIPQRRIADRVS